MMTIKMMKADGNRHDDDQSDDDDYEDDDKDANCHDSSSILPILPHKKY